MGDALALVRGRGPVPTRPHRVQPVGAAGSLPVSTFTTGSWNSQRHPPVSPGQAGRVQDGPAGPRILPDDLFQESGDQGTRIAAGVAADEEIVGMVQDESLPGGAHQAPPEEPAELPLAAGPGQGKGQAAGEEPTEAPGRAGMERPPHLQEDVLRVRTSDHQAEEVHEFLLGDLPSKARIGPVPADLGLDDIAEAQPSRQGHRDVLVIQDLRREVLGAERLQDGQGHPRLDAAPVGGGTRRSGFGTHGILEGGNGSDPILMPAGSAGNA
jgi:hypothetical protein